MPIGTIAAPVRRASTATPSRASWSAPSALRVPSGNTNRTLPSSRIRLASRNASASAAPRSTGWTPPLRAAQPTTGQANSSFLPSQWMRRPSAGVSHAPSTTASKLEAWLAAMITGPSRGIAARSPSMWMRDMPRAKIRPPRARVAMSGVIELSSRIGSTAGGVDAGPDGAAGGAGVGASSSVIGGPPRRGSR